MGCTNIKNSKEEIKLNKDLEEFENFYVEFQNDLNRNIKSKQLYPIDEDWIINWTKYNLTQYVIYNPSHNINQLEISQPLEKEKDISKYMSSFFVYSNFINELLRKYGDKNTPNSLKSKKGLFYKGMCLIENEENIIELITKDNNYVFYFPDEISKKIIIDEIKSKKVDNFLTEINYRKERYKYIWKKNKFKENKDILYNVYIYYKRNLMNDIHRKILQYIKENKNNSSDIEEHIESTTTSGGHIISKKDKKAILNQINRMNKIIKDIKDYELNKKNEILKLAKKRKGTDKEIIIEKEKSLSNKLINLTEEIEKRKNLLNYSLNNENKKLDFIEIHQQIEDNLISLKYLENIKINFDEDYSVLEKEIKDENVFDKLNNNNDRYINKSNSYKNTIILIECLSEINILSLFYEENYDIKDPLSNKISNEYQKIIKYLWNKKSTNQPYSIKPFYSLLIDECKIDDNIIVDDNDSIKILLNFLLNHFNQDYNNKFKEKKNEIINNFSEDKLIGIFNGIQKTKKICCNCFYESFSFQNIINIEIPIDKVVSYLTYNGKYIFNYNKFEISLLECLDYFFSYSIKKNDNKTQICNDCNTTCPSFIIKYIQNLPKILVIILNQTEKKENKNKYSFLLYNITIPNEIDLNYLISSQKENEINKENKTENYEYELISIIYDNFSEREIIPFVPYCRNRYNVNKWYYYNDSFEQKNNKYNKGIPFILFYEKKQ